MLRPALELLTMVLIIVVTLAIEVTTEAIGDVAEAEAGVMIVETEVANPREITEIDAMIEARLRSSVTIEDEIDGDVSHTEVGDHHPKAEAVHRTIPHAIFEIHRRT